MPQETTDPRSALSYLVFRVSDTSSLARPSRLLFPRKGIGEKRGDTACGMAASSACAIKPVAPAAAAEASRNALREIVMVVNSRLESK